MKILLVTDNPSLNSGLARVGREIASSLHEVYDFSYLGLHANDIGQFPYQIFFVDGYGENFLQQTDADIVLTIGDAFHFSFIPFLQNRKDFIWISYVTIDSINYVGKLPLEWQLPLFNPDLLLTTSEFGREAVMEFLEIEPIYLPLGVGDEFYRLPDKEREELKKSFGLGDCFVIISVNRNCIRKQFPTILKAARILSNYQIEDYPGGIRFMLHTNINDNYGYNLNQLRQNYGLSNILFTQSQTDDENLNKIYNLGDCFLTTSGGEGFGLTILEAMKCGLPIIAPNYSSMIELVNPKRPAGILINPSMYFTTEECTELAMINPEEVVKSLEQLGMNSEEREKYAKQAQENAQKYSWNEMKEGIIDIIETIEKKDHKNYTGDNKIKEVDLIYLKGTWWENFTYAKINNIYELENWNSTCLNDAIIMSDNDWVALIGKDVKVQRGWLCELLKSATEETAVVVSSCIDSYGKTVEGEVRCGTNLLYFPEEGLPPGQNDKELSATIFSAVLINRKIFEEMGGFKENMRESYFDIEYCLRCKTAGHKIITSSKSIILKTKAATFSEKDGHHFKLETETKLNTSVFIQYKGSRQKIKTIYGDLEQEPIKFPYRQALDLVCNYKHIDFVDINRDINILAHLFAESGRALIARNMGLGDVFSALYFGARPLKIANPNIHLAACVNKPYAGIVGWLPWIDEVLIYPDGLSMAKEFDYFKDLSYIPESKDPKSQSPRPEIFASEAISEEYFHFDYEKFIVPKEHAIKAQKIFADLGIGQNGRKVVGIQATCDSPIRVYAPEYLAELIKLLINHEFDVVLFGMDTHWRWGLEKWNGEHLFSFINQTEDLEMLVALIERCDYAIAPDSGLMHLWAFMKKPTLALFGNINPENRCKYYPTVTTLYPEGELDCIPCGDVFNPCPECSDLGAKGIFSGRCMRRLYPERVFVKFMEMIGQEFQKELVSISKCPICEMEEYDIINELDYWDDGKIPITRFARCRNDGLVFVVNDAESIVYEQDYFQSKQEKFYEDILSQEEIARQKASARRVLDEYYK